MSDREKLIELLAIYDSTYDCDFCPKDQHGGLCGNECLADHLISNGVTVQKWTPVSERLPDVAVVKKNRYENHAESVRVLCACKQKSGKRMVKEGFCKVHANGTIYWSIPGSVDSVTHWMPLPEPPKECE